MDGLLSFANEFVELFIALFIEVSVGGLDGWLARLLFDKFSPIKLPLDKLSVDELPLVKLLPFEKPPKANRFHSVLFDRLLDGSSLDKSQFDRAALSVELVNCLPALDGKPATGKLHRLRWEFAFDEFDCSFVG